MEGLITFLIFISGATPAKFINKCLRVTGRLAGKDHLSIADAESSSVRTISLTDGAVKGLVGGDRDPTVSQSQCIRLH